MTNVRIPPIASLETAIRLYYSKVELSTEDVKELFPSIKGKDTISRLKRKAREVMIEDGTYLQTLTVEGVTANNRILVLPTEEYIDAWFNMDVTPIAQDINSITFTATAPENINMVVDVIIYNL